jgi:hypothetical protein
MLGAVLSADDATRAFARCDEMARAAKHGGATETLDQLRCDAFTGIMLGDVSGTAGEGEEERAAGAAATGAQPPRPVAVSVVIALTTLLGLDSKSACLDGYGAISAGAARSMIKAGDPTLTRLLCDPVTGATIVADPTRYTPTQALAHAISCRDRQCRMPACGARIRHLDHIQAKVDAGLTTSDNLHGLCERSHLAKHHPGWRVTGDARFAVTWQTPTGHRYTSTPPPATGYGTGPPCELDTPLEPPDWLSFQQRLRYAAEHPPPGSPFDPSS